MPSTQPSLWVQLHTWWLPAPVPVTGAWATLVWMAMLALSDLSSQHTGEREESVQ